MEAAWGKRTIRGLISITLLIILWEFLSDFVVKNPFLLPSFIQVVTAFIKLARTVLIIDIATSLLHFFTGLAMSCLVGIPIGSLMGWSRIADQFLDPIIEILRPIPPIAWVPLAIIWFHLTHFSAGFIVFIGAIFPILVNTYVGFRGVERRLVEAARVLGCNRGWSLIGSVAIPSALPSILGGIRVGMGVGWMCVVAAEIFGVSESGIGYRIFQKFYFLHQMDNLIVYMLILGLIALAFDKIFRKIIDTFLLQWRSGAVIS
ncbi:ABC transporter permease [[Eubacterium] cellulosolvens]